MHRRGAVPRAARRGLLAVLLLWGLPAGAEPDCPPPAQPLDAAAVRQGLAQARDHGFLWQVDKDGRRSWLYGSLHVATRDWMFPGPTVRAALHDADQVALELDVLDPDVMRRLQSGMAARPGAAPLPPALAQRLQAQAEAACVGAALTGLRPEMQAITLEALAGRRQGLDPSYGVDAFLAGLAHGLGKPVISLETPEQQLALLLHDDPAQIEEQVGQTLDELEHGQTQRVTDRLARDWAQGRLDDLQDYAQWCDCMTTAEQRDFQRRLIDDRNLRMAQRIDAMHAAGHRVFVAVGALHLVGPQGLPALLAARGYQVRAVPLGGSVPSRNEAASGAQ